MKLKDLKKKLNQEIDEITPDVFSRAKATPINKLLTSATPTQVFHQTLVTRVLAIMCVLFIAMTVTVMAYFFSPEKKLPAPASDSYVQIKVISYGLDGSVDGVVAYGYVIDKNGNATFALDEVSFAKTDDVSKTPSSICAEYALLPNDNVTIAVLNDSDRAATDCALEFVGAMRSVAKSQGVAIALSYRANDSADGDALAALVSAHGTQNIDSAESSYSTLISLYAAL